MSYHVLTTEPITELIEFNVSANHTPSVQAKYQGVEAVLIAVFTTVLIFLSIAGNLLVCVAVCTERYLRKSTNFFYVSLALADMFVATLVMTFAAANDILGYWPINARFCSVWLSFDIMGSTASILNLCTISMDRYIHIKFPLRYEACMTPTSTLAIISAVWICSALISFVPIHLGWHSSSVGIGAETDGVFNCYLSLNSTYAIVSSCVSFYVPCAVMIFIYYRMYRYAKRHLKVIKRTTCNPDHSDHMRVSDQKAAITLGVIMGTFLFCWFPFFTMNVIAGFCQTCVSNELFAGLTWLGYINSSLNPIIYSIFNKEFRRAFHKILCIKLFCCRNELTIMNLNMKYNHSSSLSNRSHGDNGAGTINGTSALRKPLNPKPV